MSSDVSNAEEMLLANENKYKTLGIQIVEDDVHVTGKGMFYSVPKSKGGVMTWYNPNKVETVIVDPGTEFERIFDPTTGRSEPPKGAAELLKAVIQEQGGQPSVSPGHAQPAFVPETIHKNELKVTFAVTGSPILITSRYYKHIITENKRFIILIKSLADRGEEMLDFVSSNESTIGIHVDGLDSVLVTTTAEYTSFEFNGFKFQIFKILDERFPGRPS